MVEVPNLVLRVVAVVVNVRNARVHIFLDKVFLIDSAVPLMRSL